MSKNGENPPDCRHWEADPDSLYPFPWGPICKHWIAGVACRRADVHVCPTLGLRNLEVKDADLVI
jgi:hypothetical protein